MWIFDRASEETVHARGKSSIREGGVAEWSGAELQHLFVVRFDI
jgi:hypothetical protein